MPTVSCQRAHTQLELLSQMIEDISGELALEPLLARIVERACKLIGADDGVIGLYLSERDAIRTAASYKIPQNKLHAMLARGQGLTGRVLELNAPVRCRYGDLPLPTRTNARDMNMLGMPIRARGKFIGVFGVGAWPPHTFGDDAEEILDLFARHAAIAIENVRLFERSRQAALLEQRQRLARDLHDNLTQILSSMSLITQSLPKALSLDPSEGARRIDRLGELSRLAFVELRELLRELSPETPTGDTALACEEAMPQTLQRLLRAMVPAPVRLHFVSGDYRRQDATHEEAILRVSQEAVSNAVRHAAPQRIDVTVKLNTRRLRVTICDDGHGMAQQRPNGMGLGNMRARLNELHGALRIAPLQPHGTRVEASLPRHDRATA